MTLYYVNTGSGPNTHDGDSLRTAFNKINANFNQINSGSLGSVLIQSPSVPQGYGNNTFWYDTESGRTYIYYDGNWVDANPSSNQNNSVSVSLYDPDLFSKYNTVTNVTNINFDSLADFSVTNQGNGSVLVGMNSTFKFINIAGQQGLTAQGVDTLNLIAGTGTQIVLSNQGIKNQQTITFVNTGSGNGNASFPNTTTSGYLYNDGLNNISWDTVALNTLTNGSASFTLNSNGSVTFGGGTQSVPYTAPQFDSANISHAILLRSTVNSIQYNSAFYFNPSTKELGKISSVIFSDNTQQTTAWQGSTSSLFASSGAYRSSVILNTATLKISTGTITFPDLTTQRTAYTGTVAYSNITNVPVVTTSSLNNNGFSAALSTSGALSVPNFVNFLNDSTAGFAIYSTATGGVLQSLSTLTNVSIVTTSSINSYQWSFNNDGTITFPDATVQRSAGRNVYDSIFSGTKFLSIVSSGTVIYPDGTGQTTAFKGTATSLQNNSYLLRPVAKPLDVVYGSPSDMVGDIAFDDNYLYYCLSPYANKVYSVGTVNSATNVNYIYISQSSTKFVKPNLGWTFQQVNSSTIYTAGAVSSGAVGPTPIWILTSATAVLTYTTGTVFTVTNTTVKQSNWIKTAVTNATSVTRLSKFVAQGESLSNDVIRVQWQSSIQFNLNSNQFSFSSAAGTISDIVYSVNAAYHTGVASDAASLQNVGATLISVGPISFDPGDTITMIISSVGANFSYRVTAMTGVNFTNNFVSIEQLL
jgi:hypothetical protein